jgi:hypothetical protein
MMPQAAKMRIRLELVILVFMVRCVLDKSFAAKYANL